MALTRRGDGSRVRSGDLNHQVKILKDTQVSDGQGGRVGTPATVATVWAKINPLSVSRSLAYGITYTSKPHELEMRYEDDAWILDEDNYLEVVATGQILYIHSVLNADMRYRKLTLLATEKR